MKILLPQMPPRQFVTLCSQEALSTREVANRSGRHHSVVERVRRSIFHKKIAIEKLYAMRDSEIWAALGGKRGRQKIAFVEPDYVSLAKKLATKKYLKDELYCEYIDEFNGQNLMSLRTFYRRLDSVCSSPKMTMRLSHNPGEVMQSDFTGDTCHFLEGPQTPIQREMFASTVGVSGLIFLKSTRDQKTNSWIDVYNHALEFYGGVPPIWTMDNLKAAVLKNNAQGVVLNPVFEAMGHYYSVSIQPARPIKPQDKAKVEAAVKLIQRAVRMELRRIMPRSISELDSLLLRVAEAINNKPMRGHHGASRREIFEEIDRPALAPLPASPFLVQTIRRNVLVTADYRVTEGQITYSVPHTLIGEHLRRSTGGNSPKGNSGVPRLCAD
jgi:transposase